MSRPAPLDHAFDGDRFAELLIKARGNNTQAAFADSIPMSRTYLSSYIRSRYERPLMPQMLCRIAAASEGRVTFEELLDVSGYDPKKYSNMKCEPPKSIETPTPYEKEWDDITDRNGSLKTTIGSELAGSGLKLQKNDAVPKSFDLGVSVFDQAFKNWYFIYLGKTDIQKPENTPDLCTYGLQLMTQASVNDKVSFVTEDPTQFEKLTNQSLPTLQLYVSAILVDIDYYRVVDERYISTALAYSEKLATLKQD